MKLSFHLKEKKSRVEQNAFFSLIPPLGFDIGRTYLIILWKVPLHIWRTFSCAPFKSLVVVLTQCRVLHAKVLCFRRVCKGQTNQKLFRKNKHYSLTFHKASLYNCSTPCCITKHWIDFFKLKVRIRYFCEYEINFLFFSKLLFWSYSGWVRFMTHKFSKKSREIATLRFKSVKCIISFYRM